jgi:hypothetical protein
VFPSERLQGSKPLDLASVLKKKIQPAFRRIGITGVGWHTFRHSVGTMLAEMGEHQLTIRDYLRHSNLKQPARQCLRLCCRQVIGRAFSGCRISLSGRVWTDVTDGAK